MKESLYNSPSLSTCSNARSGRPCSALTQQILLLAGLLAVTSCGANEASRSNVACATPTATGRLPSPLDEISGLAVSERYPGILWMIEDRGPPVLHAVDSTGASRGVVTVTGAQLTNWEDLAIARCDTGTCLYVADIGDNLRKRETIHIYRVAEPDPAATATEPAREFTLRYPDAPHDAEALIVLPDERIYIVTKGRSEPITVYRAPPLTQDTLMLEQVQTLSESFVQLPDLVTGASATLDGTRIALRTYRSLQLYSLDADTLRPLLPGKGIDLGTVNEPQGEGVGLRSDGVLFLNSEQGLFESSARPPISRVACRFSPEP